MFGKNIRAHRFIFREFFGHIPSGKVVLHNCDNPACVRPDHLRLGTIAENNFDMKAKGRTTKQRGEGRYNHKMTWEIVDWIRTSPNAAILDGRELAAIFGVSEGLISDIRRGKRWVVST